MQPAGYLYDPEAHAAANARGDNYWFAYAEEVFRQLGLGAEAVNLRDAGALQAALVDLRVLVVGDARSADAAALSAVAGDIADWVRRGGTLVGFAAGGLDDLFGNAYHSVTPERDGGFAMTALLHFRPGPLTSGVYEAFFADQPLPLYGPLRKVRAAGSEPLADLMSLRQAETEFPAVTLRRVGQGLACYFAFDLAQTMWVLHKGRPVDGDHDLDGYLRLSDAIATGALPQDVPFADLLLFVLQNVLHSAGLPLIHQVPPEGGEVADLLIFFGGDGEGRSDGSQVAASDFMRSRGLPYHINIMPDADGRFALTRADHDHIVASGHETSLHYNFIDGFAHPSGFTQEDVERQWGWYVATFGRKPVATVNHWCRWTGWVEPARWMRAAGGRADNSRLGVSSPPLNPTDRLAFAFGTAFPHYYYEDAAGGNERIDFLAEPAVAYEIGYYGDATDPAMSHRLLDLAAHYHMTANLFHHPVYIAQLASCRRAIDEVLSYTREGGLRVAYRGPDSLWEWWDARARSSVDVLSDGEGETSFLARCEYPGGMVVKVPARRKVARVEVGGAAAPVVVEDHLDLRYALVVCPGGETEVRVTFA